MKWWRASPEMKECWLADFNGQVGEGSRGDEEVMGKVWYPGQECRKTDDGRLWRKNRMEMAIICSPDSPPLSAVFLHRLDHRGKKSFKPPIDQYQFFFCLTSLMSALFDFRALFWALLGLWTSLLMPWLPMFVVQVLTNFIWVIFGCVNIGIGQCPLFNYFYLEILLCWALMLWPIKSCILQKVFINPESIVAAGHTAYFSHELSFTLLLL